MHNYIQHKSTLRNSLQYKDSTPMTTEKSFKAFGSWKPLQLQLEVDLFSCRLFSCRAVSCRTGVVLLAARQGPPSEIAAVVSC